MPELAEAETIARGLQSRLPGREVDSVEVVRSDLLDAAPSEFSSSLEGARIVEVGRRGKNVVVTLNDRTRQPGLLVVNLGMSGRLLFRESGESGPPPSHPGVLIHLCGGDTVVYDDPRRFGRLRILDQEDYDRWSDTLGPEPLAAAFSAAQLTEALAGSRTPIRSWLLDQRRVAGVGNIYANEALHRAGIHPALPASSIAPVAAARLHRNLRRVLRDAIAAQGTTLRDYRTAQGWEGSYGRELRVYGKEGEPCPGCGTALERLVLSNRSAFFCPACQPREPS